MTPALKETYTHTIREGNIEASVSIPVRELMTAAIHIAAEEKLSFTVLNSAFGAACGKEPDIEGSPSHEGYLLLLKAINRVVHEHDAPTQISKPQASQATAQDYAMLRKEALLLLRDPLQTHSLLMLHRHHPHTMCVKDGCLDNEDLKAVTFLILDQTEKPGIFLKELTENFKTTPPECLEIHKAFASSLLSRARINIALDREKSPSPPPPSI
jgi:hypothetical protein